MLKGIVRPIYYALFRAQLRIRCWLSRDDASLPPAMLRYRVCESLSAAEFLRIGEACAGHIEAHAPLTGRVLDFGCGCGRTLRWLIPRHPDTAFYGADVDAEAIEWCAAHLRGSFAATGAEPPLPYAEAFFDTVYCFSVFTHLDEPMQNLWLRELRRVVKPGGTLIVTVHSALAQEALDPASRAALESRGFVHQTSRKLRGIMPEWYHTTWHSRDYIVALLQSMFVDVRYIEVPAVCRIWLLLVV